MLSLEKSRFSSIYELIEEISTGNDKFNSEVKLTVFQIIKIKKTSFFLRY